MIRNLFAGLLVGTALAATAPALATDIDTTGSDNGNVYAFGSPDTASYGQTFFADGTTLSSFSLYLRDRSGGDGPLDIRGFVGTWDDATSTVSSILYTSTVRTMNANGDLQEFSFAPAVSVTSGNEYIAFLSIAGLPSQRDSAFGMPDGTDTIRGNFVYLNTLDGDTDVSALTTNQWSSFIGERDVFFKASFGAAVPEPASWAMMIGGVGFVGGALRRKRAVRTTVRFA